VEEPVWKEKKNMFNSLFRRFLMAAAVAAFGILMLGGAAFASPVHTEASYTFKTLNDNADPTFNQLLGINNSGVIAGYFGSGASGHPNKGYTLVSPYGQGNYTNENFPGSVQTQVTGLNNLGDTVGFWVNGTGKNLGFVEWNGVFTSYKNPNTGAGTVNQLLGINDKGIAVGFYTDANGVNHAYKLNQSTGKFSAIVPPGSKNGAAATGINDNGDIVGFLTASDGTTVAGFLYKGGHYTEFDFPNSTNTTPFGVNIKDQIVGSYVDSNGAMHGFLLSSPLNNAHWKSIDDPNGIGTTVVNGLNDNAQLVGFYVDGAGNTDGFLATK
jgi:probable HAF family extracellular repeat protein